MPALKLLSELPSLATAFVLALAPIAPAEHVHDAVGPDGHHHVIAHRHSPDHALAHHHPTRHPLSFDDVDPILTVEAVYVAPPAVLQVIPVLTAVASVHAPTTVQFAPREELIECISHGPPSSPSTLRAPPVSSLQ